MILKLFTDPSLLARVQRNILARFLEDYEASMPPEAVALMYADLNHEQFCAAWAAQFSSPNAFAPLLLDALIAIGVSTGTCDAGAVARTIA